MEKYLPEQNACAPQIESAGRGSQEQAATILPPESGRGTRGEFAPHWLLPPSLATLTGLFCVPLLVITWHHARDYWLPMQGFLDQQIYFKHFVTLFFVLSGFILGATCTVASGAEAIKFYLSRIAKWWPVHALCLLFLLRSIPEVFTIKGEWMPVFLSNLFMVQTWIPAAKWYWSYNSPSYVPATLLWCEFAFPLILLGAGKAKFDQVSQRRQGGEEPAQPKRDTRGGGKGTAAVFLCAVLPVVALIVVGNLLKLPDDDMTHASLRGLLYVSPLARLLEFTTGVLAALSCAWIAPRLRFSAVIWTALELCVLGLLVLINVNSAAWQIASLPYIGRAGAFWLHNSGDNFLAMALFVSVLAMSRGLIAQFFRLKPIIYLSEISISLYMLHAVFSAYFFANFLEEGKLLPAAYFFGSLFFAAVVAHQCLFRPASDLLLRVLTRLMQRALRIAVRTSVGEERSQLDLPATGAIIVQTSSGSTAVKIGLITLQAFAAIGLFYLAVPTVKIVPGRNPPDLNNGSRYACNVQAPGISFFPWFTCREAQAKLSDGQIKLTLCCEADQPQAIDYFVTARVTDEKGEQTLSEGRYAMDGRRTRVKTGTVWRQTQFMPAGCPERARFVCLKISRGKRQTLVPNPGNRQLAKTFNDKPVMISGTLRREHAGDREPATIFKDNQMIVPVSVAR